MPLRWQYLSISEPVLSTYYPPEVITISKWEPRIVTPVWRKIPCVIRGWSVSVGTDVYIHLDRWEPRLSQPVPRPAARGNEVGLQVINPFPRPNIETLTLDKWESRVSQPVFKAPPLKDLGFSILNPFPIPEYITLDRWEQPLSTPKWSRTPLVGEGLTIIDTQALNTPTPNLDMWESRISNPTPPARRGNEEGLRVINPFPIPEYITLDRWSQPLSEPVRPPKRLVDAGPQVSSPFPIPYVTLDMWFQNLEKPLFKAPRPVDVGETAINVFPIQEYITLDRWSQPLSEPIRPPKRLVDTSISFSDPAPVSAAVVVPIDRWLQPLSLPVWSKIPPIIKGWSVSVGTDIYIHLDRWEPRLSHPVPRSAQRGNEVGIQVINPFPLAVAEIITLDKWDPRISQPVSKVRPLSDLGFNILNPFPIPVVGPTDMKWYSPLSVPTLTKKAVLEGCMISVAEKLFTYHEAWSQGQSLPLRKAPRAVDEGHRAVNIFPIQQYITLDRWEQPLSLPVWRKVAVQEGATFNILSRDKYTYEGSWTTPLTEPVRRIPRPVDQGLTALNSFPIQLFTYNEAWSQGQSLPVRKTPRGVDEGERAINVLPIPAYITLDRWQQPLSTPVWQPKKPISEGWFTPALFNNKVVYADAWSRETEVPVKQPAKLVNVGEFRFDPEPIPQVVVPEQWYVPLSLPQWAKAPLLAVGLTAIDPKALVSPNFPGWFTEISQPLKRGINLTHITATPFLFTPVAVTIIPIDRWQQPLSLPVWVAGRSNAIGLTSFNPYPIPGVVTGVLEFRVNYGIIPGSDVRSGGFGLF